MNGRTRIGSPIRDIRRLLAALVCTVAVGCGGLSSDLSDAITLYEEARYEQVAQWVEQLSTERAAMSEEQRLRFHYLAGMTAYRLGQTVSAHHHLALASVLRSRQPNGLSSRDALLLERTFEELKSARRRLAKGPGSNSNG